MPSRTSHQKFSVGLPQCASSQLSAARASTASGTDRSSAGIGASVALNIVNDSAIAGLEDGAALTGARDLNLAATGTDSMTTEAKGGAAGGTALTSSEYRGTHDPGFDDS